MGQVRHSLEKEAAPSVGSVQNAESAALMSEHEKRALRKFDIFLLPAILLLILLAWLDRTNIGNAKIFGLEKSLGLKGNQFNNISTLFFPFYILLDVPWVVAVKRFGASRVLCISMIGFTAATLGMGFCHTYAQAIGCRLVLGAFEAGLLPATIFIISTIWDQNSQGKRIAVVYIATAISGAFGGLIAYATQVGGDRNGLEAWRWLFIIEGTLSGGVGLLMLLFLPTSAEKAWFLNASEQEAMRLRAERTAIYKGEDQTFRWSYFAMAVFDPFVVIAAITLFTHSIAVLGYSIFLPTIIRGFGYTALQANYLTIPVYIFGAVVIGTVAFLSDRFKKRALFLCMLVVPGILGYAIVVGTANKVAGYIAMFLCAGGMATFSVIFLAWVSNNVSPEYKRSVALPFVLTITNCSGLIGSQLYIARDAPRYVMGNAVSMGCEIVAVFGVAVIFWLLRRRNAQKEKLRAEGATTNGLEGDKALGFTYLL
ncbi:hypothetical protein LTS17_007532 [Exophiala oligosperma]